MVLMFRLAVGEATNDLQGFGDQLAFVLAAVLYEDELEGRHLFG